MHVIAVVNDILVGNLLVNDEAKHNSAGTGFVRRSIERGQPVTGKACGDRFR